MCRGPSPPIRHRPPVLANVLALAFQPALVLLRDPDHPRDRMLEGAEVRESLRVVAQADERLQDDGLVAPRVGAHDETQHPPGKQLNWPQHRSPKPAHPTEHS